MSKGYEVIGHTADIGIRVYGNSLEVLFINAAKGMMEVVLGDRHVGPRPPRDDNPNLQISITAVDENQLLVKWLQEILYLFEVKKLLAADFKILNLETKSLAAEIKAVPFDPKKHIVRHQIKAVTYYGLEIKKSNGLFEVTIIFDI